MATVVMRMSPYLPWDRVPEIERRFRRLLAIFLGLVLAIALMVVFIKLPEPPRIVKSEMSERLVQLVQEKKAIPPPPVEVPKVEEAKPEEPEKKPEEKPIKPEVKPVELQKPVEEQKPDETAKREQAKQQARKQFAAAGFDALADLRSSAEPAAQAPSKQQLLNAPVLSGPGDSPSNERAMIADRAKAGSGGVVTARASVDQGGGGGISGNGTSRVVSGISGTGGVGTGAAPASTQESGNSTKAGKAHRPDENIQLTLDTYKGALQALYQRALREKPDMKGRVFFRVEIQASGQVSKCEIVSSELGDADLERKLVARIRQIDFGAMDVSVWNDTFHMDFI